MNKKFIFIAISILISIGALYGFTKIQYYPDELIVKSEEFIHFLHKNNLQLAYDLTTKKREYYDFSSSKLFKKAVDRQASSFIHAKKITVKYKRDFPLQTYGNRVRRWFLGREVNPKTKSIDFLIYIDYKTNNNSVTPFEVRWRFQADKSWKISFFQSHAA